MAVLAAAALTSCGSSGSTATSTSLSSSNLPTANTTADVVAYLQSRGAPCDKVDVENEGPTAAPIGAFARAICYRTDKPTLELLVYHSAQDRIVKRPEMMVLPCGSDPRLRQLAGLSLSLAEAGNFDVRATSSAIALTPPILSQLNAETEQVASHLGLHLSRTKFNCAH